MTETRFRAVIIRFVKTLTLAVLLTGATGMLFMISQSMALQGQAEARALEIGRTISGLHRAETQAKPNLGPVSAVAIYKGFQVQGLSRGLRERLTQDQDVQIEDAGLPPGGVASPLIEISQLSFFGAGSVDALVGLESGQGVRIRVPIQAPVVPNEILLGVFGCFFLALSVAGRRETEAFDSNEDDAGTEEFDPNDSESDEMSSDLVATVPAEVLEKFRHVITSATSLIRAAEAVGNSSEADQLRRALRAAAVEMAAAKRRGDPKPETESKPPLGIRIAVR